MEIQNSESSLGVTSQIDLSEESQHQIKDLIQEVERLNIKIQSLEAALALKEETLAERESQIQSYRTSEKEREERRSVTQAPNPLLIGKRGASWM